MIKSLVVVSVVPMLTMSITVVLSRCRGRRQSEADNKKSDSRDDSVHLDWLACKLLGTDDFDHLSQVACRWRPFPRKRVFCGVSEDSRCLVRRASDVELTAQCVHSDDTIQDK